MRWAADGALTACGPVAARRGGGVEQCSRLLQESLRAQENWE